MKATFKKYILDFKRPSGTSRGILTQKETWFLILADKGRFGIGECGLLRGLAIDDLPDYEARLQWTCDNIHLGMEALWTSLMRYPSIQFGMEQAFISLESDNPFTLFPSDFTNTGKSIDINGLIWMGDKKFMLDQITQKLEEGFHCLKMKIGAINFDTEIFVLESIRNKYSPEQIELRVDANGAFEPNSVLHKIQILAKYGLHSIEQPLKPGHIIDMKLLCKSSAIPVALDEELIGIFDIADKEELLRTIRPHYIILKPSLVGGFKGAKQWIDLATKHHIGWWITSALESNVGLNAIAQWTFDLDVDIPQGLGTGDLYKNNINSPLVVEKGKLFYRADKKWKTNLIQELCT